LAYQTIHQVRDAYQDQTIPARETRRRMPDIVSRHVLPTPKRFYERLSLRQRRIGREAVIETVDAFNEAEARLAAAVVHLNPNAKSSGRAPNSDQSGDNSNARRRV